MKTGAGLAETIVRRVGANEADPHDLLAVEEPLEIRLGFKRGDRRDHKAISITMRTPGEDAELAAGFLFTEGIVRSADQIERIRNCGPKVSDASGKAERINSVSSNTIRVDLMDGVDADLERLERHFYTSSSCGVCGKSSIEALNTGARRITDSEETKVDSSVIHTLVDILRSSQNVFEQTGGLHASALFSLKGELDIVREDVGRHNALDKVIGAKFLAAETPLSDRVLLVSGRASFELVQKALMAGIPIMAAVGAPSSLAVELAKEFDMTLLGFVRDGRFNIYAGEERII